MEVRENRVGNKIRFEVFKRDSFACQYCGRTPPGVILEIDHVVPRSAKGKDTIDNYLTSCRECNRGKGKHSLTKIPQSLKEKTVDLEERELQITEYTKLLKTKDRRTNLFIKRFYKHLAALGCYESKDRFPAVTLKKFFERLPETEVIEAIDISWHKNLDERDTYSPYRLSKYFYGICWNKIKGVSPYDQGGDN